MEKVKLVRNAPHQKYHTKSGEEVPGGSTICKIGESPEALIAWAWKLGTEGKDYRKERDRAADIGTIAHFMCEAFLNGFVCDLSDYEQDKIDKALGCYSKFLEWWDGEGLEKVATETQLVHDALRYGGTIDLVAKRPNGDHVLIDLKTSKRINDPYWRQVAGYAQLWDENHGQLNTMRIKDHAIVRIGKEEEGDFQVVWKTELLYDWLVFKKQLELYWAMKEAKEAKPKRTRKNKND